jgi:hypothetical protein
MNAKQVSPTHRKIGTETLLVFDVIPPREYGIGLSSPVPQPNPVTVALISVPIDPSSKC